MVSIKAFFFKNKKLKFVIIVIITLIIISNIYAYYKFNLKYKNSLINHVTVISKESTNDKSITYLVKIGDDLYGDKILLKIYLDNKNNEIINNKDTLFFNRYGNYSYGDVLYINKKADNITLLKNDYEFNYKEYLSTRNIIGSVSVYDLKYIYTKNSIIKNVFNYKKQLDSFLSYNMGESYNLFKAIIYGEDFNLNDNIKEKFISIGQSITLSVSGTNIYVIYIVITFVFENILNKIISFFNINPNEGLKKYIYNILLIICYFIFYIFSGYKVSVLRVVIIYSLVAVLKIFNIKIYKFKKLIVGSLIFYIINPNILTSVSFILGSIATIGIYILYSNLKNYLLYKILKISYIKNTKNKINKSFKDRIFKYIIHSISIYISCILFILPIQIYFFNYFSFISVISNIFINSLYLLLVFFGTLLIMLFKIPFVSDILVLINNSLIYIINFIVEVLNNISLGINIPSPNFLTIILYYITLLLIIFKIKIINMYIYKFNKKIIKNIKKLRYRLSKISNVVISTLLILTIIVYIYTSYFNIFVNHFNVGQGNMSMIKDKEICIVIDIGSSTTSSVDYILTNYMLKKGIKDIDYLIITHLHADHVNGLYKLKDKILSKEIIIKNIIYSVPKDKTGFDDFIKFLDETKINKIKVNKDTKIKIGDDIVISILSPDINNYIHSNDLINSNSTVSLISLYNTHHLFLGDSTIETEKKIIENYNNIKEIKDKLNNLTSYVVAHHGSNTSSLEEFLKFTNSKNYIISAKKSKFNHPSPSVIESFKKFSFNYHITEIKGNKFINIK